MNNSLAIPKIIAHRGYSSLFPQNTIEGIIAAMECSDFAELDVLLTKDNHVVVLHDSYLSELTNVQNFSQWSSRRRKSFDHDKQKDDYWVDDWTLDQLKRLTLRQRISPDFRSAEWNWKFVIPTLEQLLKAILKYKENLPKGKSSGLMIELKQKQLKLSNRDLLLVDKVIEVLQSAGLNSKQSQQQKRFPILLASFGQALVQKMAGLTNLDIIQLIDRNQPYDLDRTRKFAHIIGITSAHLLRTNYDLVKQCHDRNLKIFYWTVANDKPKIGLKMSHIHQVYLKLTQSGIDGIITQFPQFAQGFLAMWQIAKGRQFPLSNQEDD